MTWLKYIMVFSAAQGAVITIAMFTINSPRKRITNILYALLVVLVSYYLFINSIKDIWFTAPKLYLLSFVYQYAFASILHLLLETIIGNTFKLEKKHLLNAFPVILYLLFWVRYLFMPKGTLIHKLQFNNIQDLLIADYLVLVLSFYFVYKSWHLINKEKKRLSGFERGVLKVFGWVILITYTLWMLDALQVLGIIPYELNIKPMIIWNVSAVFSIFYFTYFVIIQAKFFTSQQLKKTYSNSPYIGKEELDNMSIKITDVMSNEKPYLDPDFTLDALSKLAGIEKSKLSFVINKHMNKSFFYLINNYRVNEFLKLASSSEYRNYSLLGIAYESGFKSKSTFYKIFRELKGKSPKEYLE